MPNLLNIIKIEFDEIEESKIEFFIPVIQNILEPKTHSLLS